jgi:hypothetical protein
MLTDPQEMINSPRIRTNFSTVMQRYLIAHEGQMPLPIWFKLWAQEIREEYRESPAQGRELIREKKLWLRSWWEEQQFAAEGERNQIVTAATLEGATPQLVAMIKAGTDARTMLATA